jgi:peptidoglycan endopeptidase LytF
MSDSEVIQYTTQSGDTLWDLADQYNSTIEEIMAANPGVDPDNLVVGQVISISAPPPQHRPPQHRPPERRPERRPEYRPPYRRPYYSPYYRQPYRPYYPYYAPPVACPSGATPYTVQPGDSLYSIASRFGVSVDIITATNPYVNFGIPLQVGQIICLPV